MLLFYLITARSALAASAHLDKCPTRLFLQIFCYELSLKAVPEQGPVPLSRHCLKNLLIRGLSDESCTFAGVIT